MAGDLDATPWRRWWCKASASTENGCEATLTNQERGKDWEYRVIAVKKAGESAPSNTVAAVV